MAEVTAVTTGPIPAIDLEGRPEVPAVATVEQFGAACSGIGFLTVRNHGVDPAVRDDLIAQAEQFFGLPQETKNQFVSPSGNPYRGYKTNLRTAEGLRQLCEGFEAFRYESPAQMLAAGYTGEFIEVWDETVYPSDEFRTAFRAYLEEMLALGDYVLRIAALALDLPADWFADKFDRQDSALLVNHYPALFQMPTAAEVRRPAHTDYGGFTLLYQTTDAGGLEIENRAGEWVRVPFVEDSYVINLGDMMANWTNRRWVATSHRVRNSEPHEMGIPRISLAFFQNPNGDAEIAPISTCMRPGESPLFEPIPYRDWSIYRRTTAY